MFLYSKKILLLLFCSFGKNPEQNLAIKIKQSGVDGKTLIATHNAKRIAFLNSLLAQNKAALNNASASAKIFAGASIVAANAVNFLSFAFGKLQAALGIIFAVTAAFQLFGFDVIGEISKIFQDFSQRYQWLANLIRYECDWDQLNSAHHVRAGP